MPACRRVTARAIRAALAATLMTMAAMSLPYQSAAAAGDGRVVLASSDPEFQLAVRSALAPIGMSVVEVGERSELASPEAANVARGITETEAASALVWVVPQPGASSVLAVFDRTLDRVVTRPVPYTPPFPPPEAASAARMIRTMLRALHGGGDIDPGRRGLRLEAGVGLRVGGASDPVAPALTASAAYYRGWLGIGLGVTVSPSQADDSPGFVGYHRDDSLALTVRAPMVLSRWVVEGETGLAVHRTHLTGALPLESARVVTVKRWNPAFRVGGNVALTLTSWVEPVLFCEMDVLARRQRFLSGASVVANSSRVQLSCGLGARFVLP